MRATLTISVATFALLLLAEKASAQVPYRYVPPAGPTLPNALNYFRRDVGVLDPYNAFVAPRRQLDSQLQGIVQQQQTDFRAGQQQIQQIRQSTAAPTGVAAGYRNYSHYYPRLSGAAGNR